MLPIRKPRKPEEPVFDVAAQAANPELSAERDRLIERMTIMQSELGGLFYEMAIRDHVRMDVLIAKAAELQEVDTELAAMQQQRGGDRGSGVAAPGHPVGGHCPACEAPYLPGAAYCSQCAQALPKG